MKLCSIHKTNRLVVIFRRKQSQGGGLHLLVPMVKLERATTTISSLGQAMVDALNAPAFLEHPLDFKTATKDMVEYAGFKSWGAFAKATESTCSVVLDGEKVTVTPEFRDGRSFSGDRAKVVVCELTVESLGITLFNVLGMDTVGGKVARP
jgi:hypothetical protein